MQAEIRFNFNLNGFFTPILYAFGEGHLKQESVAIYFHLFLHFLYEKSSLSTFQGMCACAPVYACFYYARFFIMLIQ